MPSRGGVPESDGSVLAHAGEMLAIGAERHARHAAGVPHQPAPLGGVAHVDHTQLFADGEDGA